MKQNTNIILPSPHNSFDIKVKKKKKKKEKCCEKFKKEGKGCCKSCPINWA